MTRSDVPRPVLTPEEHTDRPLTPEQRERRAELLAGNREANRRPRAADARQSGTGTTSPTVPRQIFRFLEWTLRPDLEPDAVPVTHRYGCLGESEAGVSCGAHGPESEDLAEAQCWPFEHIKEQREHRSYVHRVAMPALMVPKEEPA